MALTLPMASAVTNQPASSSEYNRMRDNVLDLDARLGAVVSASTAHARLTALEAITADTATSPGGIGNQRLADRFGSGVGTGSNVTTGSASSQLADLRTRAGVLENADACYAYQSTEQVIAQGTAVTLQSELLDTNTMHGPSNLTRITIKRAGVYLVSGMLGLVGGGLAASRRIAWIGKNGSPIDGLINIMPPTASPAWNLAIAVPSAPVQFALNDYIELFGYWGTEDTTITGVNRKTVVGQYGSFLSAVFLRP
jgi:hypothetical protein